MQIVVDVDVPPKRARRAMHGLDACIRVHRVALVGTVQFSRVPQRRGGP